MSSVCTCRESGRWDSRGAAPRFVLHARAWASEAHSVRRSCVGPGRVRAGSRGTEFRGSELGSEADRHLGSGSSEGQGACCPL